MVRSEIAIDRHQALRLENNRAIKAAALELSRIYGLGNFRVEQISEAAQVSRRTFFNHFGSIHDAIRAGLRDILAESSENALAVIAAKTDEASPQTLEQVFEAAVSALESVDFTSTVTDIWTVLGTAKYDQLSREWFAEVFAEAILEFRSLIAKQAPQVDALARNLLAENLVLSLNITAEIWLQSTAGLDVQASRELWKKLYRQTTALLRHGFAAQ